MKLSQCTRLFKIIAILLTFVMLAAACAQNNEAPVPATATSAPAATDQPVAKTEEPAAPVPENAKPYDGTKLILTTTGDNWFAPIDEAILADFTAETGIEIEVQRTPSDQYANLLKTKFMSGEGPDIAMVWAAANAAQFFPEKNFLDLSSEPWVAEMTEAAKRNSTFNNKVIGFGYQGGDYGWAVTYNGEVLEQVGVTGVPNGSWESFIDACAKVKAAGLTPFVSTFKLEWSIGIWMAQMGPLAEAQNPGLYDKLNSNQAKFADQQVFITFIENMKEMYDKGYFGDNPLSGDGADTYPDMNAGKVAFSLGGPNPEASFTDNGLVMNPKISSFPAPFAGNKYYAGYDGSLIRVINKNSKNIEAAKEYFKYCARTDALAKWYADPQKSSLTPAFNEFYKNYEWPSAVSTFLANSNGEGFTIMETGIQFWDNTNFGKYCINAIIGDITPKQALELIDADREALFAAQE